jgi:hypothetical protein
MALLDSFDFHIVFGPELIAGAAVDQIEAPRNAGFPANSQVSSLHAPRVVRGLRVLW